MGETWDTDHGCTWLALSNTWSVTCIGNYHFEEETDDMRDHIQYSSRIKYFLMLHMQGISFLRHWIILFLSL